MLELSQNRFVAAVLSFAVFLNCFVSLVFGHVISDMPRSSSASWLGKKPGPYLLIVHVRLLNSQVDMFTSAPVLRHLVLMLPAHIACAHSGECVEYDPCGYAFSVMGGRMVFYHLLFSAE